MGRRRNNNLKDYRHTEAKNNLLAGIAPTYEVRERQTRQYEYDPHLDPQLIWAGKAEHTSFEVDVVSLHIHERISTAAILRAVRRPEPIQPDLFGETPLPADKQVEFYRHEVGWANRLILGDSLSATMAHGRNCSKRLKPPSLRKFLSRCVAQSPSPSSPANTNGLL